jgi:large subunit ribosomal protein L17
MRHKKAFKKFGRTASHRNALFRSLSTALVLRETIETTVQKAKDLRRVVEKLITKAKVDTLANRRLVYSYILDKSAVQKLFTDIAPRYKGRAGGYTRIVKSRTRVGDAASLAVISLVEGAETKQPKKRARKTTATTEAAAEASA